MITMKATTSKAALAALATAGIAVLVHAADTQDRIVEIKAKRFEYSPSQITLKQGEPVVLKLISLDRLHGFSLPELGIRSDIPPGQSVQIRIVPQKVGTFAFHCDNFCGIGHEDMAGSIEVVQ